MDQTALFRACVKAMKVRKRNLHTRVARPAHTQSQYSLQARSLLKLVSELRDFLVQHRSDYINSCHLVSDCSPLTDVDRDRIDADAQTAIRKCNTLLNQLARLAETKEQNVSNTHQLLEHRKALLLIIELYLKAVCTIYAEQRAIRVKKTADRKRISRLSSLLRSVNPDTKQTLTKNARCVTRNIVNNETSLYTPTSDKVVANQALGLRHRIHEPAKTSNATPENSEIDEFLDAQEDNKENTEINQKSALEWAQNDEQMSRDQYNNTDDPDQLQQKNQQLYKRILSSTDDIQQVESRMLEIARLQSIFSAEVLQQDEKVQHISDTAIHSTENLKYGNEQIREAMKRQAGMRVYIMFMLLVLTFTLWFLHWYNP